MTAIEHAWETLDVSDGTKLDAFIAKPVGVGDHRAGVIVFQEIWGVNAHIRDVCNRFARLGYTAIAPDIFHRTTGGTGTGGTAFSDGERFEPPYTDMSGREHAMKLTPEGVAADIAAVHARLTEILSAHEDVIRIAACGFCMGGRLAFAANALLPLSCAVSFYGGGIHGQLELASKQNGPLLLFWAGKDGFITKENRRATADALDAAGKRFTEVNVGHADHGFFCDQRKSYDAEAAREAWGLVTAFFASNLDPT